MRTTVFIADLLRTAEPRGLLTSEIQRALIERKGGNFDDFKLTWDGKKVRRWRGYGSTTYFSKAAGRCAGVYWDKDDLGFWHLTAEGRELLKSGKKADTTVRRARRFAYAQELRGKYEKKRQEREIAEQHLRVISKPEYNPVQEALDWYDEAGSYR